MVRASFKVQISFDAIVLFGKLQAVTWTDVSADVFAEDGIRLRRGISGASPADRIAAPGTLEYSLDNSTGNSGAKLGYYSPSHANLRSGFGYGVPCRLIATYSATDYILFTGRIRTIEPVAGQYRSRRVHVTAQDLLADLADAQLTDIAIQIAVAETSLLTQIVTAIPAAVQPATVVHGGTDTYTYAMDDLAAGAPVLSALNRLVFSSWAKLYADPSNQLTYRARGNLASLTSSHTFSDSELDDLSVPSSLGAVFNRVRITAHPRHIDAAATTVLFAINSPVLIDPAQTVTIWGTYRDPANTLKVVGGTDIQAFTASTDVIANTASDGSGTDVTTSIDGTGTVGYASTVKFVVANNSGAPLYLTTLQIRGKAIYEDAPQTAESYLADTTLGDQTFTSDMPYQDDVNVAQDLADYTRGTYAALGTQVTSFTINPQRSDALMLQAVARDICDVVTLTETVTGVSSVLCAIQGIEWIIEKGNLAHVTYTVAPNKASQAWILDSATYSVLDSTTILAFAA